MNTDEFEKYIGRQVEVQLVSGVTLAGELVAGADASLTSGAPYAIKSLHESATPGVLEPTYLAIPSAEAAESVREIGPGLDEERLAD